MARLFGTDGVRGVANVELTPDLVLALGRAAARVLAPQGGVVVVGRDTRTSGPMLQAALVAGLGAAGADAHLAGVIPTPGVAWLTIDEGAAAGAVISASHNPVDDNGVKFFTGSGIKTESDVEDEIERLLADPAPAVSQSAGTAESIDDALDRYAHHLLGAIETRLDGVKVVLDCAFGAAHEIAPRVFRAAGAEVVALHAEPDGTRINVGCGSTDLSLVRDAVLREEADIGLAFDGDADRVLAVDERGRPVDGDQIIAMLAFALDDAGRLENRCVVTTVMANLGFRRALQDKGIEVVTAPVGDKFVARDMAAAGAVLGGEQSGHVIFARHASTGDGTLTGLKIAELVAASGKPLSDVGHPFEPYPQVLLNVPVRDRTELEGAEPVWHAVHDAERMLGDGGRVLVRPSGTENLVRVMVEAADAGTAETVAQSLAETVRRHLG